MSTAPDSQVWVKDLFKLYQAWHNKGICDTVIQLSRLVR